jgi:diphthamide synthase (EF-2-diphthine--ammonia ligase)
MQNAIINLLAPLWQMDQRYSLKELTGEFQLISCYRAVMISKKLLGRYIHQETLKITV